MWSEHAGKIFVFPFQLVFHRGGLDVNAAESELFDFPSEEMQVHAFDWLLGQRVRCFGEAQFIVVRRLFAQQSKRLGPRELAFRLAVTRCIAGVPFVDVGEECGRWMREVFSHPEVEQSFLNWAVYHLLAIAYEDETYGAHDDIGEGSLFVLRQLFVSGASPLQRDVSGVQLIANVLADTLRGIETDGTFVYEALDLEPDLAEEMAVLIREFTPVQWKPGNHHLFPDDFRARVRVVLLCNGRLRASGAPWLHYDVLELVIRWLAVAEVLGQDVIEADLAKLPEIVEESEVEESDSDGYSED